MSCRSSRSGGNLLHVVLIGCRLLVHVCADLLGQEQCWSGPYRESRAQCCSGERNDCFDAHFTFQMCCPQKKPGQHFPMTLGEYQLLMRHSSGLETQLLSTRARPEACLRDSAATWKPIYVLLRFRSISMLFENSPLAATMYGAGPHREFNIKWDTYNPTLRSMLLCSPTGISDHDLSSAITFLAERTLPAEWRPARINDLTLIDHETLENMQASIAQPGKVAVLEGTSAESPPVHADCRGGACENFLFGASDRTTPSEVAALASGAVVVIDIGAAAESEFLGWLQKDAYGNRWLLALEPDDRSFAAHPTHPRLALLQAAAGRAGASGKALFNRAAASDCSSLLPLRSDPEEYSRRKGWNAACFTAEGDAVEVPVYPLASLLSRLPPAQEVALLKVDAQGTDLRVVQSAGDQLHRVRRIQMEVHDLPSAHPDLPYEGQPVKEEVLRAMMRLGFVLDGCVLTTRAVHEEECLFVRADLLEAPPGEDTVVISAGQHRWDLPGIDCAIFPCTS
eukprot:TRINITY_DN2039_c1_g1_i1.p1 TRINITY_DN2039_c1_g1~~TRINITY_DN2039_c1_g1_i1.p1  ORF type:complete len:530 (-),score=73.52 TRINITY_DN2039_c1_g1_i1:675-2204(-)